MSRIGKKPIIIDKDLKLAIEDQKVTVSGPNGKIDLKIPAELTVVYSGSQVEIRAVDSSVANIQGLFRSLLQNAITGVKSLWNKKLELVGVGFRAQTSGSELVLDLGLSHPVKVKAPDGITFRVEENKIIVSGMDKQLVGQIAALIRKIKPPEPYKGKGIRYEGEYIRKKLGKAAKAVGAIGAK
ncbi:50S ribosomal protein L6 [Candidatus Gottesmanbacteria bacterium]|nr:50S ribosomal protein L6 [Candidatus Gottesmanbacteria bacterium]